jgi:hypothetical protein
MHKIIAGLSKEFVRDFEDLIVEEDLDYDKQVTGNNIYFTFTDTLWDNSDHPFASEVVTYLTQVVGHNDYAFIRMGEDVCDTEIHGSLDKFNLSIVRLVDMP